MSTTSSTSMNGIRLISGSSLARGRKFMSSPASAGPPQGGRRPLGGQRSTRSDKRGGSCSCAPEVVEVAREALGRQFQRQQVLVHAAAEIAPEDQGRDGDHQAEGGV